MGRMNEEGAGRRRGSGADEPTGAGAREQVVGRGKGGGGDLAWCRWQCSKMFLADVSRRYFFQPSSACAVEGSL